MWIKHIVSNNNKKVVFECKSLLAKMAQNSVLKYHVTKTNLDVFYEIDMLPPY
jgi:hypothetical protein